MKDFSNVSLASALLDVLGPFRLTQVSGTAPHGPGLFSYCALSRERLAAIRLPHPLLGVVLSGTKEVWRGLNQERLVMGTLFALPAGVGLDVVNDPDPRSGIYQSLILEITPDMISGLSPRSAGSLASTVAIPLRPELIEGITHAATAIADGPTAAAIRHARVLELLALLMSDPAAGVLFDLPVADRIAQMIRAQPDHAWACGPVARALGMSESTLRRRLRAQDSSFAAILRRERMQAARRMLEQGSPSGIVASAVGYASRAHFARAYRAEIGQNPATAPSGLD